MFGLLSHYIIPQIAVIFAELNDDINCIAFGVWKLYYRLPLSVYCMWFPLCHSRKKIRREIQMLGPENVNIADFVAQGEVFIPLPLPSRMVG